jgi:hypothetical protein
MVVLSSARAESTSMASMVTLTPAHSAVLALLDWLPEDIEADAELVAHLLGVPEAEAARLLDELEAAGDIAGAIGPLQ